MLLYWDGYEIDGSDTSFDIILPENVQVSELFKCFLSAPIIAAHPEPVFSKQSIMLFTGCAIAPEDIISETEFYERLLSGDYTEMAVTVCLLHPELLDAPLKSQIYSMSKFRTPLEGAAAYAVNPCTKPSGSTVFMDVFLTVRKTQEETAISTLATSASENAYSHNFSLSVPVRKGEARFTLGIPVDSTFEYAIYLIKRLEDNFPSIRVWGGAEHSIGASFSNSLYACEQVQIPVKHSIKNTLDQLTELGVVRSCVTYFKRKWQVIYSSDSFFLTEHRKRESTSSTNYDEYLELANTVVSSGRSYYDQIFETTFSMRIPSPDTYSNLEVATALANQLEEAIPKEAWNNSFVEEEPYLAYAAFAQVDDKLVCELRVDYRMRNYLLTLLDLMDKGALDSVKEPTPEPRKRFRLFR
jgi:hypothetical protein